MKGKKADASERRRHLEGLERRAAVAERQVERLTAELADLRDRSARESESQRHEIRDLKRQRDENAHPKIQELSEMTQRLHFENGLLQGELDSWRSVSSEVHDRVIGILRARADLSEAEIRTLGADILRSGEKRAALELASLARFGPRTANGGA